MNLWIDVFCPVPIHRGQTVYMKSNFRHQTVKTFSLSAYWATDLTNVILPMVMAMSTLRNIFYVLVYIILKVTSERSKTF